MAESETRSLLVVGLGASAGGLEAFEQFFRGMPADTGMAFVIVTHLARGQVSALPEILSRYTEMKVVSPEAAMPLEADTVYVCPPDYIITQAGRTLHLHRRGGEALSINWREADGPKVAKPKRRGFGTELIERQLSESLRGSAKFTYSADGLRVAIEIPEELFSQCSAEAKQ